MIDDHDQDEAERRRSIMAEIREQHADRLAIAEQSAAVERRVSVVNYVTDRVASWCERMAERARRREAELVHRRLAEARIIEERRAADIDAKVDARIGDRIRRAFDGHDAVWHEILGKMLSDRWTAEEKLKSEIELKFGAMSVEVDRLNRGDEEIVELPKFIRRTHAA